MYETSLLHIDWPCAHVNHFPRYPRCMGHDHVLSREPDESGTALKRPFVYLEPSRDEWIIGGPAEIRQLVGDLQAVLARLEQGVVDG